MANPNIALSFKSPQFRSPLETATRVQQLATNAMTMQKAQREAASLNALRDYIGGGGTLDTPEAVSAAIQAGANPDTVRALAAQNLDVGKFQADRKKVATERLFNRLGAVDRAGENGDDQPWVDWISEYGALGPEEAAEAKAYMNITGGRYDPAIVKSLMAGAVEYFKKTVPQAKAQLATSETGMPLIATYGGLSAPTLKQPRSLIPRAPRAGTVEVGEQTTVAPGVGGPEAAPMAAPESVAPMMPGAKSPRLSASMASSLLGLRNNADYQVALQAIKRADPAAAEELRRIMPVFDPALSDAIREAATAEFEVIPQGGQPGLVTGERGGVGGPDEGYVEAPTPFRLKSPTQSPAPGIYSVSPGQVTTTSRAEKTGVEEATRLGDLKKGLPKAKGALGLATKQLARDIADIDYVLTNPYREMVLGQIEGAFPSATSFVNVFRSGGQDAQNVQARLNKINASSVVKHLQQMRDSSPQGSSLFGQVTEYEDRLVAALAGLQQSQDEPTFERALREYRNVLVEMYQNLPQVFNDTYGEIGAKETVPSVPKPPRNSPTISDVQYLRRNKNNPNVVNGFRKEFGENAYKMAIGGR